MSLDQTVLGSQPVRAHQHRGLKPTAAVAVWSQEVRHVPIVQAQWSLSPNLLPEHELQISFPRQSS